MSLIDEALRRAEIEAARRDGLRGGAYPWVPEHQPKRRRRSMAIVGVLAFAGAAAAGIFFWSRRETLPKQDPGSRIQKAPLEAQGSGSNARGQELETVEVAPPPVGLPSRVPAGARATSSSKGGDESQRPLSPSPVIAAPVRKPPAGESRPAGVSAESKTTHGFADGKTYSGEVTVPDGAKIELEGIVFSESNPVALINGKVLGPGAVVEELTIVSIKPDRVELRGRGATIFLALK